MGLVSNEEIRKFMEYWSSMGFLLDSITNTIKNLIIIGTNP